MSVFFDRETVKKLAEARWKAGFPEILPPNQHPPRKLVEDVIASAQITVEVTVPLKLAVEDENFTYEEVRDIVKAALVGPYLEFNDPNVTADDCLAPASINTDSLQKALELDRVKFDVLSEIDDIRSLQKSAKTPKALQYVADRTQALQRKIEKAGLSYDTPS